VIKAGTRKPAEHHDGLSGLLMSVMAVASGAAVANLYYAQPLLHQIAGSFHIGTALAASIITCTQVGYAASLVLVLPLGDLHPRRRLVSLIFCAAAAALAACALAPGIWVFGAASVTVGCASVAGQTIVPFAADLASPQRRGRVVARIMTGVLLGMLLARTVSGLVAEAAGWRAIYWLSAGAMAAFAVVLFRVLPSEPARPHVPYWSLVRSSFGFLLSLPELRRRAWLGGCAFACFSVAWTALAFLLSGPPYHYSSAVIGLFGLAGVGGVCAANLSGRLADTGRVGPSTLIAAVMLLASFGLLWAGGAELAALIAGIVALDYGTQGMQITNQAVIYSLAPQARSRVNSAYMFCYFAGGALGSVTTGLVLANDGWGGVCVLGAGFALLALAGVAYEWVRPISRRAGPTAAPELASAEASTGR
jgi:predicted MFS family arabinose efflux permease